MSGDAQNWAALARVVRDRREALRLRQADLERCGGPSTGTVRNVEQAARASYDGRTVRSLETALRFPEGTLGRVLSGDLAEDSPELTMLADAALVEAGPTMTRVLARIELRAELLAEQVRAGTPVTADQLDAIAHEAAEAGR